MSPRRRGRSVTVTAVGHPAIRATHDKTLELTADPVITARATCVAGVSATWNREALAQLRGPVDYLIEAGDQQGGGTAVINPDHAVEFGFVIRRSRHTDDDTLAVASTGAAANLPRPLIAALAEPGQPVTVTITELRPPAPLVILAPGEPAGRLGVLWSNAAATVDLDAGPPSRGRSPSGRARVSELQLEIAMEQGHPIRALCSTPPDLIGPTAVARLHALTAAGARLACPADPVVGALLAAGLPPAPVLHLGRITGRRLHQPELRQLVSLTPCPVVLSAPAEEAEDVALSLRVLVPQRTCWIDDAAFDVGLALAPFDDIGELPYRWPDGPDAKDGDRLFVVGSTPGGGRAVDLDAVVLYLLDAGVPGRQIADALRPLGLRRNEIYRIIGDAPAADGAPAPDGDHRP